MEKKFRVIDGGLQKSFIFKKIKIVAAPRKYPPKKMDALVFEEDAFLIMSDEPKHIPPAIHPVRLMNEMADFTPEVPGSVVVKGKNPIRMLAVVHDVSLNPTWREEWIEKAIHAVFQKAEILKINTLGLPLLGSKHGKLEHHRFTELLSRCLKSCEFKFLRLLWLIAPVPVNADIISALKKELNC
jgi:hypothetical protein